jgi:mRNA-degrading endonuclease RelE of RelBE toxin-antitoxin system
MKGFRRTASFERDYARLPKTVQDEFWEQIRRLFSDPRHPSLDIKKMQGHREIWRGKITRGYRFTFQIDGDDYVFRRIGPHDILKKP